MSVIGPTTVLPALHFGHFEGEFLGQPCSSKDEVGGYQAAIYHPLPYVVDRFITSDPERGIVRSWKQVESGLPKSAFAYVQITHYDMANRQVTGELVINYELAAEVMEIASDIFSAKFPIQSHRLIDYWEADDEHSMSDNNSSALCVREITGGGTLSNHALGRAWDINTQLNPYYKPSTGVIAPKNGEPYLDRGLDIPGMIKEGDAVVQAFDKRGWEWGGRWDTRKDWQHFQKTKV